MKVLSLCMNLALLKSSILSQVHVDNSQEEKLKARTLVQQKASHPDDTLFNNVGFTDSNREGFNPFQVVQKDDHIGAKVSVATINIASVLTPLVLFEPWAAAASFLLQGIALAFKPTPPNPDQIYQAIYGRIQNQINTAINNKDVSEMVNNLQALSVTLNDQTVAYLALLGINENTQQTLRNMAAGTAQIPFVTAEQVDTEMHSVHTILSAPTGWYYPPPQNNASLSFVLTGVAGMGDHLCLHTRDFNIADGTDLIVDDQCNMNSLDDKMFGIAPGSELIMRTNSGDKCIAYNSKKGDDMGKHLAIFSTSSKQCESSNPHIVKLRQAADKTWSLYDGDSMLCIGDGKKGNSINVIVTREKYYRKSDPAHWFPQYKGCKNNGYLQFYNIIPVILNTGGSGGATGTSVTPPLSYDEIGVQVFYFGHFAAYHLAALKEMYLHGSSSSKEFARVAYNSKVEEYKDWIVAYVPVFEKYARFANINATQQISEAKNFFVALTRANLEYSKPVQINV